MKRTRIAIKLTVFIFIVVSCAGSFLPSVFAADEATEIKSRYAKLLADYSQFVLHPTAKSPSATEFVLKNNMVSKELAGLLRKDGELAKKEGGMGYLDFDFLVNGQDLCKPVKIVEVVKAKAAYIMQASNRSRECCKDCDENPYFFCTCQ